MSQKPPKSLLIPRNSAGKIFIQDRRGFKAPEWGFFGGSIEGNETPIEGIIRESKEELNIDISEKDVLPLGNIRPNFPDFNSDRFLFLYPTEQIKFTVLEGAGGLWVTYAEAGEYLESEPERLDEIFIAIDAVVQKRVFK